jgi:hypothetical protein
VQGACKCFAAAFLSPLSNNSRLYSVNCIPPSVLIPQTLRSWEPVMMLVGSVNA